MLITEGLAELKTIVKRIAKKEEFIKAILFRSDGLKDPLEKDGGSAETVRKELQAVADLYQRIVDIRVAIQHTNQVTSLTIDGITKTIAQWLTWRKEVSSSEEFFVASVRKLLAQARIEAQKKGATVLTLGAVASAPTDLVVNISESDLAKRAEQLETIKGNLDGQLSVLNATVQIVGI